MRTALRRHGIAWPDAVAASCVSVLAIVQTLLAPAADLTGPRLPAVILLGLAPLPLMLGRRRPAVAVLSVIAILLVLQFAVTDITSTSVPLITLIWTAFVAGAYAEAPGT